MKSIQGGVFTTVDNTNDMTEQTEQKVLDEARQADKLRKLLWEVLPILRAAIFVNYVQTKAADELYDKIKKAVRDNDKTD